MLSEGFYFTNATRFKPKMAMFSSNDSRGDMRDGVIFAENSMDVLD